ncbi:hypothetical protein D6B99_00775 [Arachidicoccus soli]|uniref:Uncharacterized protein n=1 Tax=Arachidicoccus soli TaxID=2341117 RepID=A0A386HL93_9BACT|nr:hypothetical protein D6B99_00775 [Arachidicoccus soli]
MRTGISCAVAQKIVHKIKVRNKKNCLINFIKIESFFYLESASHSINKKIIVLAKILSQISSKLKLQTKVAMKKLNLY